MAVLNVRLARDGWPSESFSLSLSVARFDTVAFGFVSP
ncbi:hypothetical protein A2U01_0071241 [Trifolium medium]|uniref:Uncharacterized protein n=1 Tax=Trifolium medium TaxID=97028 RepID=A0A392SNK9_9FABA|nr:hypothetical protein [Trifolium medium]